MALREELRSQGDWLFRRRSYLPLVLFLALIPLMSRSQVASAGRVVELAWEGFCLSAAVVGLAIRASAVGCVHWGTSGGNVTKQSAAALNTTGWYSVVRHPLYLGNFLMWMGVALLPAHAWFPPLVALGFWLYYERIMLAEEEFLRDRFGPAYEAWATRTPAFLPKWSLWHRPDLPFSWKIVLRREYPSAFAVLCSFGALDLFDDYARTGHVQVDPLWGGAFAVGLPLYVLLILLKRAGHLDVEGR